MTEDFDKFNKIMNPDIPYEEHMINEEEDDLYEQETEDESEE